MSAVLVTGGAGFIGSQLVEALLARGEEVCVLDSFDPLAHPDGPRGVPADVRLVRGDLRDRRAVARALAGTETVFHLGGAVGNGESLVNVRRAVEANAVGTATLLEELLARRDRVRRLVVASSMVVYGEGAYECPAHGRVFPVRAPDRLRRGDWDPPCPRCGAPLAPVPGRERDPLHPLSVYGVTKRDQEELALTVCAAYGVECVALRYLNVYGPGQALGNPYTGVAAIFAARLAAGRRPLVFEDGRQLRDLVHVSDVVEATLAAACAPRADGRAINVASGRRTSALELATGLARALVSPLEPLVTGEHRAGDIRHCLADTTLARELLGFTAKRRLEDALPELAEWVCRQSVCERGDEAVAQLRTLGLVR